MGGNEAQEGRCPRLRKAQVVGSIPTVGSISHRFKPGAADY
jgi:hypothetical protein